MTASMGLPDLGIIAIDDVTFFIRQVARASGLPVLVDGDTAMGSVDRTPITGMDANWAGLMMIVCLNSQLSRTRTAVRDSGEVFVGTKTKEK
jgi:2-methylisocitrate lyase-like PEP mutase family enzyme